MTKDKFVIDEFLQFSIQAGLSTRNGDYPIYNRNSPNFSSENAESLKQDIRKFLISYYEELRAGSVSEQKHLAQIHNLSRQITRKFKLILNNGRFRIGISQKIINLFLKYLWSVGIIKEPHHCPFDNIVKIELMKFARSKGQELVDWTKMDSIKEYRTYVSAAYDAAENETTSIAKWEMNHWKRR